MRSSVPLLPRKGREMWLRRRRTPGRKPCPEAARRIAEARRAREDTEERLDEVLDRRGEVRELSTSLRGLRQRNGFAEMFAQALREAR